jgi:hypothetical protein
MANKADFTSGEWQQIITAPQMASLYVALASPSGPVGVIQEMMASTKLIVDAMKASSGNALIDAVATDWREKAEKKEKPQPLQMGKDPNEVKTRCLQACRDLAALLSQKAPAEAEGYKQWVYKAAQHSAEAAKEGGFLGIGGTRVNEAEAAALKEIASALGIVA